MIANNKPTAASSGEIDVADLTSGPDLEGCRQANVTGEQSVPRPGSGDEVTHAQVLQSLADVKAMLASQREVLTELGHRDALFGQLHERLAAYEQDERSRGFLEPLARRAAVVCHRLREQAAHALDAVKTLPQPLRQSSPYDWAQRSLEATRAEFETILADFGIEKFRATGGAFDRRLQEAVERVPVSGGHAVGEIARRIAPGFRIGVRTIVPERVAVYVPASDHRSY